MLYTRKGDDGNTKTFACDQRISKSSTVAEALGALDEVNSFLGVIRAGSAAGLTFTVSSGSIEEKLKFSDIILEVQQNLFIIQAEVAGSDKSITREKVSYVEEVVDGIEKVLPPITTFFLSGAIVLSAPFVVTGEVWDLAHKLTKFHLIAIISITLLFDILLYYFAKFKQLEEKNAKMISLRVISLIIVTYATSAIVLTTFGIIGGVITDPVWAIKLIIMVGLFANIGAGTADLIK